MEVKLDSLGCGSCPHCHKDIEIDFELYANVYYKDTIEKATLLWMAEQLTTDDAITYLNRFLEILNEVKKKEHEK